MTGTVEKGSAMLTNTTERDRHIIEEQAATNRLLTDLTHVGSWGITYAPDGSVESAK